MNLEENIRKAAIDTMKGLSVCLILDHWTSQAHHNHTGITGHFIEKTFKLHNFALGIFLHEGGTDGDKLAMDSIDAHVNKVKTAGVAKIFAVTTDNIANMNTFGKKLEEMGVCHVYYCTDHVLQLTCKQLYEKKAQMEKALGAAYATSVTKGRAIVSHFNQSTQSLGKLKNAQSGLKPDCSPLGLVTDVVTHWWFTHDMVQCLTQLQPSLATLFAEAGLG
jgi:hypothetical protein